MKTKQLYCLLLVLTLGGCNSTPPAPNFSGSWQPLNTYADRITEIPLVRQHYFEPLPIDGTLKSMLSRGGREAGMSLNYNYTSDFTLSNEIARIKQPNIEAAIAEINEIYATQQIAISVESGQLTVQRIISDQDKKNTNQTASLSNQTEDTQFNQDIQSDVQLPSEQASPKHQETENVTTPLETEQKTPTANSSTP